MDRFLVTCEAYKVPATLLLSKIDLQDAEAVAAFRAVYEAVGYRVLEAAAPQGEGLEAVRELLAGRTTLVAGNSGVEIDPDPGDRPVARHPHGGDLESHRKGRHTTTFSAMYPWPEAAR